MDKFRVWDQHSRKLLYFSLVLTQKKVTDFTSTSVNLLADHSIEPSLFDDVPSIGDISKGFFTELEHSTGIYDGNGKEIYEHDIVEMSGFRFIVRKRVGGTGFELDDEKTGLRDVFTLSEDGAKMLYIVGNIHEEKDVQKDHLGWLYDNISAILVFGKTGVELEDVYVDRKDSETLAILEMIFNSKYKGYTQDELTREIKELYARYQVEKTKREISKLEKELKDYEMDENLARTTMRRIMDLRKELKANER